MSRIGNMPIAIPEKVSVTVSHGEITVKGPLGLLKRSLHKLLSVTIEKNVITVTRVDETREARSVHGLYRMLIANMVEGVTTGFVKALDLVGVGYRAEMKGTNIQIALGFSHPVVFEVPASIKAEIEKQTRVTFKGADKELVGETAARFRRQRPPEPYKQKGVRYVNEVIRKKVGKSAAGAGAK